MALVGFDLTIRDFSICAQFLFFSLAPPSVPVMMFCGTATARSRVSARASVSETGILGIRLELANVLDSSAGCGNSLTEDTLCSVLERVPLEVLHRAAFNLRIPVTQRQWILGGHLYYPPAQKVARQLAKAWLDRTGCMWQAELARTLVNAHLNTSAEEIQQILFFANSKESAVDNRTISRMCMDWMDCGTRGPNDWAQFIVLASRADVLKMAKVLLPHTTNDELETLNNHPVPGIALLDMHLPRFGESGSALAAAGVHRACDSWLAQFVPIPENYDVQKKPPTKPQAQPPPVVANVGVVVSGPVTLSAALVAAVEGLSLTTSAAQPAPTDSGVRPPCELESAVTAPVDDIFNNIGCACDDDNSGDDCSCASDCSCDDHVSDSDDSGDAYVEWKKLDWLPKVSECGQPWDARVAAVRVIGALVWDRRGDMVVKQRDTLDRWVEIRRLVAKYDVPCRGMHANDVTFTCDNWGGPFYTQCTAADLELVGTSAHNFSNVPNYVPGDDTDDDDSSDSS